MCKRLVFSPLLLLVLVLSACGAAVPTASDEAAEAEDAVILFWYDPSVEGEGATCYQTTVIDPFNEMSDTIFVDAVAQPETWNATRTALLAGEGPDIVRTSGPSFVVELAQAGQLLPLDDYVASEGWDDLFVGWALSLGEVEGTIYSLADELETLVLYYNKTLFEQKGWIPPSTVAELYELAAVIAADDIVPFAHTNAEWRPANEWHVGEYFNHVAGPDRVYEALTGQIPWTHEDFVTSVELLDEAQQNGWFSGGLELYYTLTFDEVRGMLGRGEAAMNIEAAWIAADLDTLYFTEENGGMEWDWVPTPSQTGDPIYTIGMGNTWSINRNSEHPEAVAKFLSYSFSPESQAALLRNCGKAPAPVRLTDDAMEGVDPRIAAIFIDLAAASESGGYGYTTWTFWPPRSDAYIYEEIERVWSGDITAKEYLQGLDNLFQEEFAAGAVPPIPERR
ncbi:MAG: extracellular solute-binding protein [Caldilineaceae bacterium]|nr:extracellular solute-binding protein [Caldilineaceae bacterium]